ncbi:MAG: prepilin-type N-terminal cleavage/methylation domain-containing protein [Acidobacteriota bacterium]|nr:prepilin-type N-terminal cleavage/methylation domain-containing protein [Acidobacteriota bacterium]
MTGTLHRDDGFTLIELMISVAIVLVILGGALTSFNSALKVNDTATQLGDSSQNLRAGTDLMVRDLLQTGAGIPTGGIPIPSGAGALALNRPSPPGDAYTFDASSGVLPSVTPGAAIGPVVDGQATDMITVLYADSSLALNQTPLTAIAADGSGMTVDAGTPITNTDNGIKVGDLIMFSNALGNALQMVTRVSGGQTVYFDAGDPMDLNQRTAPQGTIMQLQSGPGVFPPTTATRIEMITFYVDPTTTPGAPRLVRQVGFGPALALAGVIEDLQISYDLVDGVTNPTDVKAPVAPNTPSEIRKVNLQLGVRSDDRVSQLGDYLRTHLNTQVSLRNLAFVDRYQ